MTRPKLPCSEVTCDRRRVGYSDYCSRCRQQFDRTGYRPCNFCGLLILLNHTPNEYLAAAQKKIACIRCADLREKAWSWDYDACTDCGTTDQPHKGHGRCNACIKGGRSPAKRCICGAAVRRNYGQTGRTVRCLDCFKRAIRKVFHNYHRKRTPCATSRLTTIDRAVVAKCFRYLATNDRKHLTMNAGDIVCTVLTECQQQLAEADAPSVRSSARYDKQQLEALVLRFQQGDTWADHDLIERLTPFVRSILIKYGWYHPWGTLDDMVQDVLIGVCSGLRKWQPGGAPVLGFVHMITRRRGATSLQMARRQKHQPMNDAVSFDQPDSPDNGRTLHDRYGTWETPEALVIPRDTIARIDPADFAQPGTLNHALLYDYLDHPEATYEERSVRLSKILGYSIDLKSIDNARGRLRRLAGLRQRLEQVVQHQTGP